MIRFVLQAVLVLGLSGGLFWYLGGTYLTIAAILACVFAVMLLMRGLWSHDHVIKDDGHELSSVAIEFVLRLFLAMMLGAIWPSLPFIVYSESSKRSASKGTAD